MSCSTSTASSSKRGPSITAPHPNLHNSPPASSACCSHSLERHTPPPLAPGRQPPPTHTLDVTPHSTADNTAGSTADNTADNTVGSNTVGSTVGSTAKVITAAITLMVAPQRALGPGHGPGLPLQPNIPNHTRRGKRDQRDRYPFEQKNTP
mmetsp:Transcript_32511/g.76340  ORF Transcript_32511/g.76340 Transcript_32511/m.76340 type:complete len:151 (+) Transcript_32511:135-587(+)